MSEQLARVERRRRKRAAAEFKQFLASFDLKKSLAADRDISRFATSLTAKSLLSHEEAISTTSETERLTQLDLGEAARLADLEEENPSTASKDSLISARNQFISRRET